MTDDVLVTRIARGDSTAVWLLYERHRGVVFRFVYRLTGSRELAEDVAHDTFVALMTRPQGYDASRGSLRTYLCGIARNLARVHRRRWGRETEWPAAMDARAESSVDPLHSVLRQELSARVQQAVGSLRPILREVLVLIEYENFTLAETASVVGTRVGTVKTRLHRARAAIRTALATYVDAADDRKRGSER